MTASSWFDLQWARFLVGIEARLRAGERVFLPYWVPVSLEAIGFVRFDLAEDVGQVANYRMARRDGSRLHVHVFADGQRLLHRDRVDPDRGPLEAIEHLATETKIGPWIIGGVVVAAIGGLAFWSSTRKSRRRR